MKYKKKPITIDAWQFNGNFQDAPKWVIDAFDNHEIDVVEEDGPHILIKTLEGAMRGKVGDYVIKGVRGELYPCKGDIFEETYETVGQEAIYKDWYVFDKEWNKVYIGDIVRDENYMGWIVSGFVFDSAPKVMLKHGSWLWASECKKVN